mmetsp:Transcript_23113/g.69234  ORF Transcript_23113/g.69234 Transcript_23113/m.69234 type:complete len:165 (+) Transcript_23113:630-1124(+)
MPAAHRLSVHSCPSGARAARRRERAYPRSGRPLAAWMTIQGSSPSTQVSEEVPSDGRGQYVDRLPTTPENLFRQGLLRPLGPSREGLPRRADRSSSGGSSSSSTPTEEKEQQETKEAVELAQSLAAEAAASKARKKLEQDILNSYDRITKTEAEKLRLVWPKCG